MDPAEIFSRFFTRLLNNVQFVHAFQSNSFAAKWCCVASDSGVIDGCQVINGRKAFICYTSFSGWLYNRRTTSQRKRGRKWISSSLLSKVERRPKLEQGSMKSATTEKIKSLLRMMEWIDIDPSFWVIVGTLIPVLFPDNLINRSRAIFQCGRDNLSAECWKLKSPVGCFV